MDGIIEENRRHFRNIAFKGSVNTLNSLSAMNVPKIVKEKEKEREDSVELVESSSVLTDEVIERVRHGQEERAPRSVGDAETLSSKQLERAYERKARKARKREEKERKKVVQEFKKENTKKKKKNWPRRIERANLYRPFGQRNATNFRNL